MNCPYFCKICTTCGKLLIAHKINFNKKKGGKYGLRSECNLCRKQYRIEHKEELNQKDREYYQKTREERIASMVVVRLNLLFQITELSTLIQL